MVSALTQLYATLQAIKRHRNHGWFNKCLPLAFKCFKDFFFFYIKELSYLTHIFIHFFYS